MKRTWIVLLVLVALGIGLWPAALFAAGDVPPITAADFGSGPEAAFIWQLLAGQGTWGAVLLAVAGVIWKFVKPYLDEWMRQRKLATLWDAVITGVVGTLQTYVEAAKTAGGGKLTEEQAAYARDLARSYVISFMKTQGVDVLREYGQDVLDYLIEAILSRLKIDNSAVKAALAPLADLRPSAPSV